MGRLSGFRYREIVRRLKQLGFERETGQTTKSISRDSCRLKGAV